MRRELLDVGLLFLAGVVGVFQSFFEFKKRTVSRAGGVMFNFAQFAIIIYGLGSVTENKFFLPIGMIALVAIFAAIIYYNGSPYTIKHDDREKMVTVIYNAVKSVEFAAPQKLEEDGKIKFQVPDTKRYVEFQEKDSFSGKKKNYTLRFKKWVGNYSKKEIIRLVEDGLYEEDHRKKIIMPTLQLVACIGMICLSLYLASLSVITPKYIQMSVPPELPESLYIYSNQQNITDEVLLKEIHSNLTDAYAYMSVDSTYVEAFATLHYSSDDIIVYIGSNNSSLYVRDSVFGNESQLNSFLLKVHRLYDKSEGSYYRLGIFPESQQRIMELLESID